MPRGLEESTRMVGLYLLALTHQSHKLAHHRIVQLASFWHILDPRAKIDSPMSEIMKGTNYESKESLE
ncbi:hypothetical protein Tco_1451038, partial [Tanacetum coccineum]